MGGAISAPAVLGVLNGCSPKPSASWQPLFLSKEAGAVVAEVAEMIIPRTDTPGARDVGVPAFIDVMLKDVYPTRGPGALRQRPEDFDAEAQRAHGKPFLEAAAGAAHWRSCSRRTMPRLPRRKDRTRPKTSRRRNASGRSF